MQLRSVKIASAEAAEVAARRAGRIYANGRAFVPYVRREFYDKLNELAGPAPAPGLPVSWDAIDVGHLVIAQEGADDGWWEAIVVEKNDDMLTLRWRDYPHRPHQPRVIRHRATVALLNPSAP